MTDFFATTSATSFRPFRPSERQFEAIILQLAESVFPGWMITTWKKRVYTPDNRGVEADLVMIRDGLDEWVVVEVELGVHSIKHHIQDQLERLVTARYGSHLAASLASTGLAHHDLERLLQQKPNFLCIVDDASTRLRDCCAATGFSLATLQPYYDAKNRPGLLCSIPGEFRQKSDTGGVEYSLVRSVESLFGRRPFSLPQQFPDVPMLSLHYGGEVFSVSASRVGDARITFMPTELEHAFISDTVGLRMIDLSAGSFEILRE